MIETPASALLADQLAAEADFLSIGTNDLSQYTLAMDRTHGELARRLDALHPASLRLIERAADAAGHCGRETAVCGALASDPVAVPLLVGLGVRALSAVPATIPRIKALLRTIRLSDCETLARSALALYSAPEVRAFAVAPRAQRRGIGRALMRAVIDMARAGGAERIVLCTQPSMTAAQRLYLAEGFVRIPERDWTPVPGMRLLAYSLALSPLPRR